MKEVKKRKTTSTDGSRPKQVYVVEHEYTSSHTYGAEKFVDRKGCFYDVDNAVLRAVKVIAEELHVDLNDGKVLMEFNRSEQVDLNDPVKRQDLLRDLLLLEGVTEEIESEGVDEHTVTVNIVSVEDA